MFTSPRNAPNNYIRIIDSYLQFHMDIIFKVLFFPFYLVKVLLSIIAIVATTLFGVISIFFGANPEDFNTLIKKMWEWAIKYQGIDIVHAINWREVKWANVIGIAILSIIGLTFFIYMVINT